jgi:folylpolyglutamate synthase/dihydropteroate synthase
MKKKSMNTNKLYQIAINNKFTADKAINFNEALKKISSKERKLIVCFGSLYNVGNILNKN